jgi:hypothetical protein
MVGSLIALQALILFCAPLQATGSKQQEPLADLLASAVKSSRLGLPGHSPFHLRATVRDPNHKDSPFDATIEEYWLSPEKWRRTIRSRDYSLITVVNGRDVSQRAQGSYYPYWLRNTVISIFDVVPDNFTPEEKTLDTSNLSRVGESSGATGVVHTIAATACTGWNDAGGPPPNPDGVSTSVCFNHLRLVNSIRSPFFTSHYNGTRRF